MSGIDRPWQRIIRKIFLKFSCVTTGLHAAQCRFQYEKLRFFNMRRVGIFFFNERHCLQTSFLVLSTSQVVYIRLKKVRFIASLFTSWSACNRCNVKRVKIIFLCVIISLFSYILRVRFGSRVWLRLRKSLKVGQSRLFVPLKTM